jgi:hypothetical protein
MLIALITQALFQKEASSLLLFLKTVEELEWLIWPADANAPVPLDGAAAIPQPLAAQPTFVFGVQLQCGVPPAAGARQVDSAQVSQSRANR